MTACPWWAPPLLAVQFLTRLPVPGTHRLSAAAVQVGLVQAVGWFPLVGSLVGAVTAAVAVGSAQLWPVPVAVLLALVVEARLTGAFHEDAVADFCDAFGGGHTADDVRRIMKDSRIGSYGAVGLGLALALRAALLIAVIASFDPWSAGLAIVASATFGRLLVVALMACVKPVGDGLARDVASGIALGTLVLAVATAAPGILPLAMHAPRKVMAACIVAGLFIVWFRALLIRRVGGSTGDCLGFSAYAGQLILLLAVAT